MSNYFANARRAGFGIGVSAAKEEITPDELLGRLISCWRTGKR